MNLHPKIKAAALAALLVAIVNVGNAVVDVYSNAAWTQVLSALIPVIAGWFPASPSAGPAVAAPAPPVV